LSFSFVIIIIIELFDSKFPPPYIQHVPFVVKILRRDTV